MSRDEAIRDIRARLKAIKEAVAAIEVRLAQLESSVQAPPEASSETATARRPPGTEQKPPFKLRVKRSNR